MPQQLTTKQQKLVDTIVTTGCSIKEAAKTRFPLDRFIGNWWSGAHTDTEALGNKAKGYKSATFTATGTDFPAMQDIINFQFSF